MILDTLVVSPPIFCFLPSTLTKNPPVTGGRRPSTEAAPNVHGHFQPRHAERRADRRRVERFAERRTERFAVRRCVERFAERRRGILRVYKDFFIRLCRINPIAVIVNICINSVVIWFRTPLSVRYDPNLLNISRFIVK